MTDLTYLQASARREDLLAVLERDAAVIVEGLLSQTQLTAIKQELAPYLATTSTGRNDFSGYATKRVGALIARSPTSRELALNDVVNHACVDFLGPHGDGYPLNSQNGGFAGLRRFSIPRGKNRPLVGIETAAPGRSTVRPFSSGHPLYERLGQYSAPKPSRL